VDEFPGLIEVLKNFVDGKDSEGHEVEAHGKRRVATSTVRFRAADAQDHLYRNVPGLYKAGMSLTTIRELFTAPNKSRGSSARYTGEIDVKIENFTNNKRHVTKGTHYARAHQKMLRQMFQHFAQPHFSGDDMNMIQIGRPAVSRYHQGKMYTKGGKGTNYKTHDFALSHLNLKLGGFMLLGGTASDKVAAKSFSEVF